MPRRIGLYTFGRTEFHALCPDLFPCIATISAIVHESGSWKWGIFVIVYTCVLAWFVSCVVYQTGHFFMNLFN